MSDLIDQRSWQEILSKHLFVLCRRRWFSPTLILLSFPSALMSQCLAPSRQMKKGRACWEIYKEGRGPSVDGGRKRLRHRKQCLTAQKKIKSENSHTMLDFMECINKESSHVLSEPLTLPSQQALHRKCQIWRSSTWSIWVISYFPKHILYLSSLDNLTDFYQNETYHVYLHTIWKTRSYLHSSLKSSFTVFYIERQD